METYMKVSLFFLTAICIFILVDKFVLKSDRNMADYLKILGISSLIQVGNMFLTKNKEVKTVSDMSIDAAPAMPEIVKEVVSKAVETVPAIKEELFEEFETGQVPF